PVDCQPGGCDRVVVQMMTLAERPDLADAAFTIPYDADSPTFMHGSPVSLLTRRTRLARRWPQFVVVLLDSDGTALARGVSVPFAADGPDRDLYPAGGWDQIAIWAAEDALDGRPTDTVCALEIAVDPAHRRRGLSAVTLQALCDTARVHGYTRLVAPVRPPAKATQPPPPIPLYHART